MKEFVTAAREVENEQAGDDGRMVFSVDGVECVAYPPLDGQLAVLMASSSRHTSMQERVAGVINFFVAVLDDDTHQYIVGRLLDRGDPFGLPEVESIMGWMVEEWTGRPTQPPSVSTQSRKSGGQRSTRRTPASISSASPPTDS